MVDECDNGSPRKATESSGESPAALHQASRE